LIPTAKGSWISLPSWMIFLLWSKEKVCCAAAQEQEKKKKTQIKCLIKRENLSPKFKRMNLI
jgi:hypothetical protein